MHEGATGQQQDAFLLKAPDCRKEMLQIQHSIFHLKPFCFRKIFEIKCVCLWLFCEQLVLECPDDILAFEFSPSDPNIIVGGCINGQVLALIFNETSS